MAEWASQFEGEHGATELVGLAVDSRGDVALAGHVFEDGAFLDGRKDALVMKLASADGSTLWTRKIGVSGSHDWSSAVAADPDGNIFVGGETYGDLFAAPSGDGQDIWVAKLDGSGGELVWGYQVGSAGRDDISALAVDGGAAGGDVVICGSTSGGLFDDPATGSGSGTGFALESGGASGAGGAEAGAGEGETEAFCAKLAASDGRVIWGKRLKGGQNDWILAAAVEPLTGDVFATGYTAATGGSDYVVVRLSGHDGAERWRISYGGGWMKTAFPDAHVRDSAVALAVDGRGDVVIAGNTEGALFSNTAAGQDTDAFVAKLDGGNGTRLWGWQGGSEGNDYANAVAVDPSGDVYACGAGSRGMFSDGAEGEVGGSVWTNDETGTASSHYGRGYGGGGGGAAVADMFVVKLDGRSGAMMWGEQFGSGADDEAVGLVLGPQASAAATDAERSVGTLDQGTGGGNPLYLTGWTRGALFSKVPARWQDGWAVKLPNPPPKTLGVSDARAGPLPVASGAAAGAQQAAAERGAVTAGLVGTVTGMLVVVSLGLYFVLRKASIAGGALLPPRYGSAKEESDDVTKGLFRRRGRPNFSESGGGKGGAGGGKSPDGVELTPLCEKGDSPGTTGGGGSGKRDSSPARGGQQPTFYL